MKILVAAKQVLDPETNLEVDEQALRVAPAVLPRWQMNQFDEYAVEEAVALKERRPGTTVHVVSVGPERVKALIERVMGMGADHGVRIETPEDYLTGPLQTASLIAAWAGARGYDLLVFGVMAEDDMQGQVGPLVAEILGLPLATSVIKAEAFPEEGIIRLEREVEAGRRESLELRTPAVLTIQSGINKPRYPTLSGLLRAKKHSPDVVAAADLAPPEPRERVVALGRPQKTRAGLVLEGGVRDKASRLLEILKEKSFL
ncbi:MAG: electron transfer flavoprotein subunit beta/FixA family protein [Pseudomonadota bacterium]